MTADKKENDKKTERIAKRLARAGLCSRRDAEKWIADGRVRVNGKVLSSPALNVTDRDVIEVDGQRISEKEPVRLWRYHKPPGLITSHRDEKGRDTIFDHLPDDMPRVISVGRLDLNSEGLLLLTNDGEVSRHLELPSTGWSRKYRVRAFGKITQADLDKLKKGITIDGIVYGGIDAHIEKSDKSNMWIAVTLREGKNREIRRVFEHLGLQVNRLIRLSYGPFSLGNLGVGEVSELGPKAISEALGGKFS